MVKEFEQNVRIVASTVTLNIAVQGTAKVNLSASDIMVPIDLQGTTMMMPVDIQAQYLTLDINVKSQTANLNINIASSSATVTVAVSGTVSVNITQAIVNISSLKLMDSGTIKRIYGSAESSTTVLYTVPTGKKFYIFSVQLNVDHYLAGDHTGNIDVYDGSTAYRFIYLSAPDSVDQMNDSLAFTLMSIPAGWSIRVTANAYADAAGSVIGVEVTA